MSLTKCSYHNAVYDDCHVERLEGTTTNQKYMRHFDTTHHGGYGKSKADSEKDFASESDVTNTEIGIQLVPIAQDYWKNVKKRGMHEKKQKDIDFVSETDISEHSIHSNACASATMCCGDGIDLSDRGHVSKKAGMEILGDKLSGDLNTRYISPSSLSLPRQATGGQNQYHTNARLAINETV